MAKTKALISCAVTAQLICIFVFAYADCWFSHVKAQINKYSKAKDEALQTKYYSHLYGNYYYYYSKFLTGPSYIIYRVLRKFEDIIQKDTEC